MMRALLLGGAVLVAMVLSILVMRRVSRPMALMQNRPTSPGALVRWLAPPRDQAPETASLAADPDEKLSGWIRFASLSRARTAAAAIVGEGAQIALLCTIDAGASPDPALCEEPEELLRRVKLCRAAGSPRDTRDWPEPCPAAQNGPLAFLYFFGSNPGVKVEEWRAGCLKEACKEVEAWRKPPPP